MQWVKPIDFPESTYALWLLLKQPAPMYARSSENYTVCLLATAPAAAKRDAPSVPFFCTPSAPNYATFWKLWPYYSTRPYRSTVGLYVDFERNNYIAIVICLSSLQWCRNYCARSPGKWPEATQLLTSVVLHCCGASTCSLRLAMKNTERSGSFPPMKDIDVALTDIAY